MPKETYKLYKGKEVLYYDDTKHIYWDDKGQLYGVTSIIGVAAKPALVNWAVSLALKKVVELKDYLPDRLPDVIAEARKAAYEESKRTREIGQRVHAVADKWFSEDKLGLMAEMLKAKDEQERNSLSALMNFFATNKIERKHGERKIKSQKHRYAGTADFIGEINGLSVVADYKTSSAIYPDYFVQAAAYAYAIEEEGIAKVDATMIVRLGKDGTLEIATDKKWKEKMPIFLAYKQIYEWQMKLKDAQKGNKTIKEKVAEKNQKLKLAKKNESPKKS